MNTVKILAKRVAVVGGSTSYSLLWPIESKPSRPLHWGHYYATQIVHGNRNYYGTNDAIMPRNVWESQDKLNKYYLINKNNKIAIRLESKLLKRAFPELEAFKTGQYFLMPITKPSTEKWLTVRMELPE